MYSYFSCKICTMNRAVITFVNKAMRERMHNVRSLPLAVNKLECAKQLVYKITVIDINANDLLVDEYWGNSFMNNGKIDKKIYIARWADVIYTVRITCNICIISFLFALFRRFIVLGYIKNEKESNNNIIVLANMKEKVKKPNSFTVYAELTIVRVDSIIK